MMSRRFGPCRLWSSTISRVRPLFETVTGQRNAASLLKGFAFGPRRRQTAGGKFSRYTYPVKYPTSKVCI
jgi:hypothetical protein